MKFNQIITLNITEDDIKRAIKRAKGHAFMDNLRYRHPNVAFDSKLRGYIGEIALKQWLIKHNINIETTNIIDDDSGMDVDFKYKGLDIELKTSLIPDIDKNLETVFQKRDIKIIKRENRVEDLKGDVHIQIYYKHLRKRKDEWLRSQNINLESNDINYLYNALGAKRYINETILFSWIDKDTMVKRINKLPEKERTWGYAQRLFWKCPLRESFPPEDLIKYLLSRG
jgi:hypothetical protein